jgi:hypothetical protein
MKSIRTWLPVLALAACAAPATPRWEKPGASPTAVDEAMQECRVQARLAPQPSPGSPTPRSTVIDRIEDRDAREAEHFQKCMRDKGYSAKR